jgi:hypothetical protein
MATISRFSLPRHSLAVCGVLVSAALLAAAVGVSPVAAAPKSKKPTKTIPAPRGKIYTEGAASSWTGVGCLREGECFAVGNSAANSHYGVYLRTTRGVPGAVRPLTGYSFATGGIACSAARYCLAVGQRFNDKTTAVIVRFIGKGPRPAALTIPTTTIGAISCGSATSCWATGTTLQQGRYVPAIFHIFDQFIVTTTTFPMLDGGPLGPISCTGDSDCVIVGSLGVPHPSFGSVLVLHNGKVSLFRPAVGTRFLTNVTCTRKLIPSPFGTQPTFAESCFATGSSTNSQGVLVQIEVGPDSKGGISVTKPIPVNSSSEMQAIGLIGGRAPEAFGFGKGGNVETALGLRGGRRGPSGGIPVKVIKPAIVSVACGPKSCEGVGSQLNHGKHEGAVFTFH